MALPAMWAAGGAEGIAGTLMDALAGTLEPAFVYVRLNQPEGDRFAEMTHVALPLDGAGSPEALGRLLDASFGEPPPKWPAQARLSVDGLRLQVAAARLGVDGEIGMVVVGSARADFPQQTERLVLDVATNQAAIGLQQEWKLIEQQRVARELDERVARRTSELAAANQRLQNRERELKLIIDSIPGFICLLTPSGNLDLVNEQALQYFGRPIEYLREWGTNDTVHPEDLPSVVEKFSRSIATGAPFEILQRFKRRDGVYRWFQNSGYPLRDAGGNIVRWYVLLTDIDDRKQAEDAIRAREQDLKLIIDTIPAFVWCNLPDGSNDFISKGWHEYTGVSPEESRGWGWQAVFHPDDLAGLLKKWSEVMAAGRADETEARIRRHDGVYRWFLIRAAPFRDSSGKIVRWYGTSTDIEDRKRAEQALDKARAELAHVARVTSLGALTASIAHEINQPLSGIITNAGTCLRMLNSDPPNVDGARETARRTIRDGNRASDVIVRLRALFSKREFTAEVLDLNDATKEVIALLWNDLQRDQVVVQTQLAGDLPPVTGDRIQLQQVVLNLLRNAADAMAEIHDRPRRLLIRSECLDNGHVQLSVTDSGVGLAGHKIEKLFDSFFTTKRDGMGIGLAVSRSIIERHHGLLWAEANEGPGATFRFAIPCEPV